MVPRLSAEKVCLLAAASFVCFGSETVACFIMGFQSCTALRAED